MRPPRRYPETARCRWTPAEGRRPELLLEPGRWLVFAQGGATQGRELGFGLFPRSHLPQGIGGYDSRPTGCCAAGRIQTAARVDRGGEAPSPLTLRIEWNGKKKEDATV